MSKKSSIGYISINSHGGKHYIAIGYWDGQHKQEEDSMKFRHYSSGSISIHSIRRLQRAQLALYPSLERWNLKGK